MMKEKIIRCKECRHFETDVWAAVGGIPLIVAHEMCMKWGEGCRTSPDGFCFMAERKGEMNEQIDEEKNSLPAI